MRIQCGRMQCALLRIIMRIQCGRMQRALLRIIMRVVGLVWTGL